MYDDMTFTTAPPRILLVCGEALVREGYRRIIQAGLGAAELDEADLDRGVTLALHEPWDVVVFELPCSDVHHLEGLRRIREQRPRLPVLVLTPRGDAGQIVRVLRMNVRGYLTTECSGGDLICAIRKIQNGERAISADLAALALPNGRADVPSHAQLSDREYEILCSLGAGCPITQIARGLCLSAKTITTYRARLLAKLQLRSTPQLVRYAIEHGLVNGARTLDSARGRAA